MTLAFVYPSVPHERRHGLRGYADHESYRQWPHDEFAFRCVYCLSGKLWGSLKGVFALDHFLSVAARPDRAVDYDNLLYRCVACNLSKGSQQTPDPLSVLLASDVTVSEGGRIHAGTPHARKLIELLGLDRPRMREFREMWIRIVRVSAPHDPALFRRLMGYPVDLPDLSTLRAPEDNTRPDGIAQSHFGRRQRGELADTY
jgi:hypothetical protein